MTNLFFDIKDLKYCGRNVIIGKTVRIRYPELVSIGDNCIIDDFTYISTGLELGKYVHITPNVTMGGGKKALVKIGNFSSIGAGSAIYTGTSNYLIPSTDSATIPEPFREGSIIENIIIGAHVNIGVHSVILPGAILPDGFAAAAGTVIRKCKEYKPWTLYGGYGCKELIERIHEEYDSQIARILEYDSLQ